MTPTPHSHVFAGVAAVGIGAVVLLYVQPLALLAIAFCVVAAVAARYSSTLGCVLGALLLAGQVTAAVVVKVDDLNGPNFLLAFALAVVPSIVLGPGLLIGSLRRLRTDPPHRRHVGLAALLAATATATSGLAVLILFWLR